MGLVVQSQPQPWPGSVIIRFIVRDVDFSNSNKCADFIVGTDGAGKQLDGLWAASVCVSSGTLLPTLVSSAGCPEDVSRVLRMHYKHVSSSGSQGGARDDL